MGVHPPKNVFCPNLIPTRCTEYLVRLLFPADQVGHQDQGVLMANLGFAKKPQQS